MIDELKRVEKDELLDLLINPSAWKSLNINYHPPHAERVWAELKNGNRIYLHFIHHCEKGEALNHPHPWPSAMHVLNGRYEMGVGYGEGNENPEMVMNLETERGGLYYDMTHRDGWHYVRPMEPGNPVATVMLAGKPWDRWSPGPEEELKPLDEARVWVMLEYFKKFYRDFVGKKRAYEMKEKIEAGNWVEIVPSMLIPGVDDYLKNYIGIKGYVIKNDPMGSIEVRFGSSRSPVPARTLKISYQND
jgi:hypothetical protein